MDDFWQAGLSSICRRALGDRGTVDRPALGEELCAAESFCFDGFGCGELAINVQFGAQPTGMEQATLPSRSSAWVENAIEKHGKAAPFGTVWKKPERKRKICQ